MNLYQKLVEVRKAVPYLKKEAQSGKGDFGYNYTASSQVLGAVRQKLDDLNILLITRITDKNVTSREKGKPDGKVTVTYEVEADIEFTWINAEEPTETIVIPWLGMGLDTGDNAKAIGKALTYAEKYFMLKQFNIATDKDDPDYFQEKVEATVKEFPSEEKIQNLVEKATKFAGLRNQTVDAVYKALKIKDVNKLTMDQFDKCMINLDAWIAPLEKVVEEPFQEKEESSSNPLEEKILTLVQKATEFADLRTQKVEAVYKALKIKDVNKLTVAQIDNHLLSLDTWIAPLKKALEEAQQKGNRDE